jgi:hypothetical protein
LIRHPIYAGWLLLSLGFALAYPSWRNFAIVIATVAATLWRVRVEEALLAEDPEFVPIVPRALPPGSSVALSRAASAVSFSAIGVSREKPERLLIRSDSFSFYARDGAANGAAHELAPLI